RFKSFFNNAAIWNLCCGIIYKRKITSLDYHYSYLELLLLYRKMYVIASIYLLALCYVHNIQAKVTIHSFGNCEQGKDYALSVDLKIKHDGDKNIVEEGVITNKIDFTKDIKALIEVFHDEGGEWKELAKKEDTLCSMRESFVGEFAEEVEKAAGITDSCLIKKGEYKLSNFVADFSKMKYKDFLAGKSKVRSTMRNGADIVGCLEIEFTIEK
ncbi:unnamed protein product, partial [Callosobruchus maculatus]